MGEVTIAALIILCFIGGAGAGFMLGHKYGYRAGMLFAQVLHDIKESADG